MLHEWHWKWNGLSLAHCWARMMLRVREWFCWRSAAGITRFPSVIRNVLLCSWEQGRFKRPAVLVLTHFDRDTHRHSTPEDSTVRRPVKRQRVLNSWASREVTEKTRKCVYYASVVSMPFYWFRHGLFVMREKKNLYLFVDWFFFSHSYWLSLDVVWSSMSDMLFTFRPTLFAPQA